MKTIDKDGSNFDVRAVQREIKYMRIFRGTVSVFSRDPPGKEGNVRFTPVPI